MTWRLRSWLRRKDSAHCWHWNIFWLPVAAEDEEEGAECICDAAGVSADVGEEEEVDDADKVVRPSDGAGLGTVVTGDDSGEFADEELNVVCSRWPKFAREEVVEEPCSAAWNGPASCCCLGEGREFVGDAVVAFLASEDTDGGVEDAFVEAGCEARNPWGVRFGEMLGVGVDEEWRSAGEDADDTSSETDDGELLEPPEYAAEMDEVRKPEGRLAVVLGFELFVGESASGNGAIEASGEM